MYILEMRVLSRCVFWLVFACALQSSKQMNVSDTSEEATFVEREECMNNTFRCECSIAPCVRKCCPPGQYVVNSSCEDTSTEWDVTDSCASQATHEYLTCENGTERLLLNMCDNFSVTDGFLIWPLINSSFSMREFCVDFIDSRDIQALICITSDQQRPKMLSTGTYCLVIFSTSISACTSPYLHIFLISTT